MLLRSHFGDRYSDWLNAKLKLIWNWTQAGLIVFHSESMGHSTQWPITRLRSRWSALNSSAVVRLSSKAKTVDMDSGRKMTLTALFRYRFSATALLPHWNCNALHLWEIVPDCVPGHIRKNNTTELAILAHIDTQTRQSVKHNEAKPQQTQGSRTKTKHSSKQFACTNSLHCNRVTPASGISTSARMQSRIIPYVNVCLQNDSVTLSVGIRFVKRRLLRWFPCASRIHRISTIALSQRRSNDFEYACYRRSKLNRWLRTEIKNNK